MTDDDVRKFAKRRLKAKADFHVFLGIWVAVSALLVAIWYFTSRDYFWPMWPILGVGIAAVFIGLDAYGPGRRFISEAAIDAEVERMTRRPPSTPPT